MPLVLIFQAHLLVLVIVDTLAMVSVAQMTMSVLQRLITVTLMPFVQIFLVLFHVHVVLDTAETV